MTAPQRPRDSAVSTLLEETLSSEVRRHGHVLWLDRDGHYTAFVDGLHTSSRLPVVAFRSSFLESMFALEERGSSLDRTPVLVHVPGHNKETIRRTPLLEFYESARVYERALPSLVRDTAAGRVAPEEIERFVSTPGLTLEAADRWLHERQSQQRDGLDAQLAQVTARLLADELLGEENRLGLDLAEEDVRRVVAPHLERLFGLPGSWWEMFPLLAAAPLEQLRSVLWSWVLCVEYVSDLRRAPHLPWLQPLRALPGPLVTECRAIAVDLRKRHPDAYERGANEVEELLGEEQRHVSPTDLGAIDTFGFEAAALFGAALEALRAERWADCLSLTTARVIDSFWLSRDQARRWEWLLLEAAARLGKALSEAQEPLKSVQSSGDAVDAYATRGAAVDALHRRLEQICARLLEPRLPHFGELRQALAGVRAKYREWADGLARAWARVCREQGFLPEPALQQRMLFEQVVEPLARTGEKVAFFVVDALRYEMAAELVDELKTPGTVVELKPRLAELPTLTSVGMNVLAPVAAGGRLTPVLTNGRFGGFRTGEYAVGNPDQRVRAMGQKLFGEPALKLALSDVADMETDSLKRRVAQSRGLVVVHGTEIDDGGEANLGVQTFEHSLRQLRAAIAHLQQVGLKQFVVTADHGFLLQDDDEHRVDRRWGTARDPGRRHVLTTEHREEADTHVVSLAALQYDGAEGYLVFRDETGVFRTGVSGATFVHGGNSLQERVIPVLTVTRKHEVGGSQAAYAIEARRERDLMGHRHLRFKVTVATESQGLLGFTTANRIDLALRVVEPEKVSVILKDVAGGAELVSGRIRATVGAEVDVYFGLQGPTDGRARVELHHPDGTERVAPLVVAELFDVTGTGLDVAAPAGTGWKDKLVDAAVRSVFEHIERYDVVTESQLMELLGNARALRRFAAGFESFLAYVPFEVRVESTTSGKQYVKGGARDVAES